MGTPAVVRILNRTPSSKNTCLICNAIITASRIRTCSIFEKRAIPSGRLVVDVVNSLLEITLTTANVHTDVICRKCFKFCEEVDQMEEKISVIKLHFKNNYNKTLRIFTGCAITKRNVISKTGLYTGLLNKEQEFVCLPNIAQRENNIVDNTGGDVTEFLHSLLQNRIYNDDNENMSQNEIIEIGVDCLSSYEDDVDVISNVDKNTEIDKLIEPSEFVNSKEQCQSLTLKQNIPKTSIEPSESVNSEEEYQSLTLKQNIPKALIEPSESVSNVDENSEINKLIEPSESVNSKKECQPLTLKQNIPKTSIEPSESVNSKKECQSLKLKQNIPKISIEPSESVNSEEECQSLTLKQYIPKTSIEPPESVNSEKECQSFTLKQNIPKTSIEPSESVNSEKECQPLTLKQNIPKTSIEPSESVNSKKECQSLKLKQNIPKTSIEPSESVNSEKECQRLALEQSIPKTNLLITRMAVHREENGLYKCLICPPEKIFKAEAHFFMNHFKLTHNTNLFICKICGAEFFKKFDLSAHLYFHDNDKCRVYKCRVCYRLFDSFRSCEIHKKLHGYKYRNYICETCGVCFGSLNMLQQHKNSHVGRKLFYCLKCDKSFASQYSLKIHEKTHDDARDPTFACINCGKRFFRFQNLTDHEKIHIKITSYTCQECGKSFDTAHNLELHVAKHIGLKPHVCRLCAQVFRKKVEMLQHQKIHVGERLLQCHICKAAFSRNRDLSDHIKAHKKFVKCRKCRILFRRRLLLDYHRKVCHPKRRYVMRRRKVHLSR